MTGYGDSWARYLDRWLHPATRADRIVVQDGRALVALLHLASVVVFVFGLLHGWVGNEFASYACAASVVGMLAVLNALTHTTNVARGVHAFLAVAVASIATTAVAVGDQRWIVLLFLGLLPAAPAALMELRSTLIWVSICLLVGSAVIALDALGVLPDVRSQLPWRMIYWLTFATMLGYSAVSGFIVRRGQRLLHFRSELERVEAAEVERMRAKFLANVSHELRTPLHGLLGTADNLLKGSLSKRETAEGLQIIRASADTLLALVNDLLDMTRSEKARLEPVVFRPNDLVRDVLNLYRAMAQERGLGILSGPNAADLRGAFVADRRRITQVLTNLISNAIKYTPSGSVTLDVSMAPGVLLFTVSDTGRGIPPEVRARMFEPYVTGPRTPGVTGTGLGLSICRGLAVDLGGELTLEDSGQGGACFRLAVPVKEVSAPDVSLVKEAPLPDLAGMRVLLAEDHPVNQHVTSAMVRRLGGVVDVVENGKEAVAALERGRYDALLLDLFMPELDGAGVLAAMLKRGLRTHVIVMSAQVSEESFVELRAAGAHAYLSKPCGVSDLAAALQSAPRPPTFRQPDRLEAGSSRAPRAV